MVLKNEILKKLTTNQDGLTVKEITKKVFGEMDTKAELNKNIAKIRTVLNRDLIKNNLVIEIEEKRNNSKVFKIKDGSEITEIALLKDLFNVMIKKMRPKEKLEPKERESIQKIGELIK